MKDLKEISLWQWIELALSIFIFVVVWQSGTAGKILITLWVLLMIVFYIWYRLDNDD
jgi:hypothetical protein